MIPTHTLHIPALLSNCMKSSISLGIQSLQLLAFYLCNRHVFNNKVNYKLTNNRINIRILIGSNLTHAKYINLSYRIRGNEARIINIKFIKIIVKGKMNQVVTCIKIILETNEK